MKFGELEKLKPYRIVKNSGDGTFLPDEIIWISENGNLNAVHYGGFLSPKECNLKTLDFEAEPADDWEIISVNRNEFCRKK